MSAQHVDQAIFECRDVSIGFETTNGVHTVLEGVDLNVGEGEFLSVIGSSGTGKTTLLRVLAGLAAPQPGSVVTYHGTPVTSPPQGTVYVFQDYAGSLLPWRTVRANIALGIERTIKGAEREARVAEALELVGLAARADDHPWRLSGGMQQRVQIARALAMRPEVLLMDEPFGALDAMTKASLQDELLRLQAVTGTTIVFVTHDIDEAVYLSDRVILLNGSPAKIGAEFSIGLPRPRHQVSTRESPEYLAYRHELHRAIGDA